MEKASVIDGAFSTGTVVRRRSLLLSYRECAPRYPLSLFRIMVHLSRIDQCVQGITPLFDFFICDLHILEKFYLGRFVGAEPPYLSIGYQAAEQFPPILLRAAVNYMSDEGFGDLILDLKDGVNLRGVVTDI